MNPDFFSFPSAQFGGWFLSACIILSFSQGGFANDSEPTRTRLFRSKNTEATEDLAMALEKGANEAVIPIRIALDPGHGGKDDGAKGKLGLSEKNLSLQICTQLKERLIGALRKSNIPVEIRLTRETDLFVGLQERVNFANSWDADLFLSVHANWSPSAKASGFEVYFLSVDASDEEAKRTVELENSTKNDLGLVPNVALILQDLLTTQHIEKSSQFAEAVFNNMVRDLRPNKRAVRQGPFTVLSGTRMPAILIEVGYLTNFDDSRNLAKMSYLMRVSGAISAGIVSHVLKERKTGKLS